MADWRRRLGLMSSVVSTSRARLGAICPRRELPTAANDDSTLARELDHESAPGLSRGNKERDRHRRDAARGTRQRTEERELEVEVDVVGCWLARATTDHDEQ